MSSIKKLGNKIVNGGGFFTFIRSSISSQIASWTDMGTRMLFYAFVFSALDPFYRSNLSVAVGAFVGGVVNCCINYRFTFHAEGVDWRSVIVKYALVWIGSMLLNAYGTQAIYYIISDWTWLENLGFKPDGYYAAARIFTSLVVSWFWNFVMQRYFVYRNIWLDRHIVKYMDAAGIKKAEK